ncbi:hypothetical protein [Actinokineospora iranica]|uniref:hypothetical protein n=1 Tax=Actinokineospora iranica TaxID=1271860 RepID=UPI001587A654|nr:hypothetical protein [Actinokineospora iranica]
MSGGQRGHAGQRRRQSRCDSPTTGQPSRTRDAFAVGDRFARCGAIIRAVEPTASLGQVAVEQDLGNPFSMRTDRADFGNPGALHRRPFASIATPNAV